MSLRIWGSAVLALVAACTNVVPPELEAKLEAKEAKARAYERAVRELWVLDTTAGRIVVRLFPDDAPHSVEAVRAWTAAGVYDGTWFHRVVRHPRRFVIQGGDPDSKALHAAAPAEVTALAQRLGFGTTDPVLTPEPTKRKHTPGAVALAVSADGSRAGPQFVIALDRLPHLDGSAPVFGQIEGGWSVVEKLRVGDRIVRAQLLPPERIDGPWLSDVP